MKSQDITSAPEVQAETTLGGDGPETGEKPENNPGKGCGTAAPRGNGSVAHQLIGQFLDELRKDEAYVDIAGRLEAVVFTDKLTEADLRTALFGEVDL